MSEHDTAEHLRDELLADLRGRQRDVTRLFSYYRGDHPLPWAPTEIRDAYLALMRMSRSNWCRLIVQAPAERIRAKGIQFSDGDTAAAVDVWKRLWQGNRLDLESRMVHTPALVARRSFVLVWPSQIDGAPAKITPEHPAQVVVRYAPGDRRTRVAALKAFSDCDGDQQYATLWTPEKVYNWTAKVDRQGGLPGVQHGAMSTTTRWEGWDDPELGIVPEADNPMGVVPVIEFQPHPEMVGEPMGELDGGVTDVQDRINKTVLDRMVTSNFASFPQKWVTGLEIPKDDKGRDVEPFKAAVNRLMTAEDPLVKFGEFSVADLTGYLSSVESDIQHLAATTRTPPHYLLGQSGAFPSGDSLKATETGLVAKTLEIIDSFTESWEDVIRLGLLAEGDPRAEDVAMSVLWKNPESRSDAEKYDAATKMQAVQVPWRSIMEYLDYSPTQIDAMDALRAEDAANGLLPAITIDATPKALQPPGAPALPPAA